MQIDKASIYISMANAELNFGQLSEKAGISRLTLYRILNNKQKPMPATVGKLAKALGVPVETITLPTSKNKGN